MNSLISICIPTYKRPDLLLCAVQSCLNQTYHNIEIIISDDSPDELSEVAIVQLQRSDRIRYYRNAQPLGQAGNVNQLFYLAQGDRLVLIHDDDWLLEDAVSTLIQVWDDHPDLVACFGKQFVASMDGKILEKDSNQLNCHYFRSEKYAGLQSSSQWSALMGQFPNNGYMILTEVARAVGYRDGATVGDACDYDFGLRIAKNQSAFYFIDKYVSAYRLTDNSILRNNNYSDITFNLVKELDLPASIEPSRRERLQQYASPAVSKLLKKGRKKQALAIYMSDHYTLQNRLSVKGFIHFVLLCLPGNLLPVVENMLNFCW
ncbi:glycosyltransferase family 2 protein [Alkalinema sp. FACHB-956]|uniref:glycosyltransferase family 2 protein n=1 Tax=Alkalinema sp. FACHB-956 TaxID=2692768 RepID=UPI001684F704|nr:glycosyltransferase family 2 protein [Alkalinema sp. FACHB-956]MBD2329619.1 glycosyltransferase family 2 protein [Alkalinema sp. FACHB-956]